MKEYTRQFTSLVAFLLFAGTMALGQTAQITGQVTDASGARIPGASVTIKNAATGIASRTVTTTVGYYTLTALPPGNYAITVEKTGFGTTTRSGITLNVAQSARLDVTLQVSGQVQRVSVTGTTAPLLQSESPTLGTVIGSQQVVELPLNGRNFLQLATLTPGALSGGTGFFLPNNIIRVNGMDASNTNYEIDGIMTRDQLFSGTTMLPPPDAIQEFKVQSNVLDSRYGLAGAVVSVQLKSGTNNLHGDAYEFLRNDKLDGRNFFDLSKGELRQNQFGFTLGGPIKKDQTFFFGDYQGTRVRRGITFDS
ncbi:MAG: carboxypeptidase regulatory-like domain-containing protein, partial [Terriglobia bacterium]